MPNSHYDHCLDYLRESTNEHLEMHERLQSLSWEELAIRTLSMCITELGAALSVTTGVAGCAGGTEIAQIALGGNDTDFSFQICSVIMEAVDIAYLIIIMIRFRWVPIPGFTPDSRMNSNDAAVLLLRFYLALLAVFGILETLNGYGRPDDGGEFVEASAKFHDDIANFLLRACPEPVYGWSGEAMEGYLRKVESVRIDHCSLAETDLEVKRIISNQARQVELLRILSKECKIQFSALASAAAMTITPGFACNSMTHLSFVVVMMGTSLLITLPILVGFIGRLIYHGEVNAERLRKALDGYRHVVNDAKKIISPNTVGSNPSPVSTLPGARFSSIAGRLSWAASGSLGGSAFAHSARNELIRVPQHTAEISDNLAPYGNFSSPARGQLQQSSSPSAVGGHLNQAKPAQDEVRRDVAFAEIVPGQDTGEIQQPLRGSSRAG